MMKEKMKKVRGFTLLEMIIVLGIIAFLAAVFIPAMSGYLTRSRLNTANANAKVIFNSLQTICQEYEFTERSGETTMFYGPKSGPVTSGSAIQGELQKSGNRIGIYATGGHIVKVFIERRVQTGMASNLPFYFNVPTISGGSDPSWNVMENLDNPISYANDGTYLSGSTNSLMQRMDRLFADNNEVTYCALIHDYSVMGVVCAQDENSVYIGGFPKKAEQRGGFDSEDKLAGVPFDELFIDGGKEWTMADVRDAVPNFAADTPAKGCMELYATVAN